MTKWPTLVSIMTNIRNAAVNLRFEIIASISKNSQVITHVNIQNHQRYSDHKIFYV